MSSAGADFREQAKQNCDGLKSHIKSIT